MTFKLGFELRSCKIGCMFRWLRHINRIFRMGINDNPGIPARCAWHTSFGISAFLHIAGLGLLTCVAIAHPPRPGNSEILAEFAAAGAETAVRIDLPVQMPLMMGSSTGGRHGASG